MSCGFVIVFLDLKMKTVFHILIQSLHALLNKVIRSTLGRNTY